MTDIMGKLEIDEMGKMEFGETILKDPIDLQSIKFDDRLSQAERIEGIVGQMKDPYCLYIDNTTVRVRYVNKNKDLTNSLIRFFSNKKT